MKRANRIDRQVAACRGRRSVGGAITMNRGLVIALLLIMTVQLLLAATTLDAAEEQWLQYRLSKEMYNQHAYARRQNIECVVRAPEGVDLPAFASDQVLYGCWTTPMVEAGFLHVAINFRDNLRRTGSFLFIDADCDGSLADENPIKAISQSSSWLQFPGVKILFPGDDGPITYHANVQFYCREETKRLYFSAAGWYEGDITIGEDRQHCLLIDYNSNGAFNDSSFAVGKGDQIKIGAKNSLDERYLGTYLQIGTTIYDLEVARDGSHLAILPAHDVPVGSVQVPDEIDSVSFVGELGHIVWNTSRGEPQVPAGRWIVNSWQINRRAEDGKMWSLSGTGFPAKSAFDVQQGQRLSLDIGEPLRAKLIAEKTGDRYSFEEKLEGREGERITVYCEGRRPKAPRLQIKDAGGDLQQDLAFQYG